MPIPTELEGKAILGSVWIRRIGDHAGYREIVLSFNDAGVKVMGEQGQKGHQKEAAQSIKWPLFMNLYRPEGKLEELKVTTDKDGSIL